jgi:hypothetical protein
MMSWGVCGVEVLVSWRMGLGVKGDWVEDFDEGV